MGVGRWFRKLVWQELGVALGRSHKDRHSRRLPLRLAVWPAYLIYVVTVKYLSYRSGEPLSLVIGQTAFHALLFRGIALYVQWDTRRNLRLAEAKSLSVQPEVKRAVFLEAYLLATLLERAGSERAMEKELPSEIEVVTRRVLLDRLKDMNLLDGLEQELSQPFLAPEGRCMG